MAQNIIVTGSSGLIGNILIPKLAETNSITGFDLVKSKNIANTQIGSILDLEKTIEIFNGADTLIHLAGAVSEKSPWDTVLQNNIIGTKNVFYAAKKVGISKIIFASSNHVTGLYENDLPYLKIVKGDYSNLEPQNYPIIDHTYPIRPDGYYGISKSFGESLGRYYSELYGISIICLRIGTVIQENNPSTNVRHYATLLEHNDLVTLVQKSLDAKNISFDIFYGVSNNSWRYWDLSHSSKILGYKPKYNAEEHRK